MHPSIIDANIHRACEGLRVIEEYFRFVVHHEEITYKLAKLRNEANRQQLPVSDRDRFLARDTGQDVRAGESPRIRQNSYDLLVANFRRVQEAFRVLEEYTGDATFCRFRYTMYDLEKECFFHVQKPWELKGIYLISHDVTILRRGLELGADIVQLRCKDLTKSAFLDRAYQAKQVAHEFHKPFLINDHLDIAKIVDADGIHTGQDDISIAEIRRLWSPDKIYGRTTHTCEQGAIARDQGASYVSVGPIWATPTKPDRPAIGLTYLREVSKLGIPFVAIGGVNFGNIHEITPFAPTMIAIVRDFEHIPELRARMKYM